MASHSAYNLIAKKRDGKELTWAEIEWFIQSLLDGEVADYQMSALLMAIYLNGLSQRETAFLTDAMLYSGETLSFEGQNVIDKHSTGGVGDKTSFILAPLAAACGVKIPMMAGRGLGHSGGTIDKIESIAGFQTSLPLSQFKDLVEKRGLVLTGQTAEIAPADKKIYALRDVTATVESIPLITASIMSKKLAEGANGIVMDIKVGNGAFMRTKDKAQALSKSLRETGLRFHRNMMTIISDMNQPLGKAVGNSLEIIESIETLKGQGPQDLTELSLSLAGGMIYLAGLAKTHQLGIKKAQEALDTGAALKKFRELLVNQGGNPKVVDDYSHLPLAKNIKEVLATKTGYLSQVNNHALGLHCVSLGGGRKKAGDQIDFGVGFLFPKKIGDQIKTGECLARIHFNDGQEEKVAEIEQSFLEENFKISAQKPKSIPPLIYQVDTNWAPKTAYKREIYDH